MVESEPIKAHSYTTLIPLLIPPTDTMSSTTRFSSEQFFASWKFELDHDFTKDGQPATFFPGHPKQWGDENARLDLPKLEQYQSRIIALNEDGTLLGVGVGGDVLIYDMASLSLLRTLRGIRPRSMSSIVFQPGRGRDAKVLVGANYIQGQRSKTLPIFKCWDLVDAGSSQDAMVEAAKASASVVVRTMVGKGSWSEGDVDESKVQQEILDAISWTHLELELQKGRAFEGTIQGKVFSPDGSFFLFFKERNTVVAIDIESLQECYSLVGHTGNIIWAEATPDNNIIGTSSWDHTVRLWDAATGQEIRVLTGATNRSLSGAFSPDGKLICAGCEDHRIRVWSVESGGLLHTLDGYRQRVRSLAFSPDGKSLVATGASGGNLMVFDLETGKSRQNWKLKLSVVETHFVAVTNLLYTSRGLLVFRAGDGLVFTYDEKTNEKGQYEHGPGVSVSSSGGHAIVTPDGKTLIVADFDGCVRFWSLD
ncbi:hypothetical protein D9758_013146 [Tetrapyrgos nigripes]|uniref:WD40 repeat-like protein n=1 Tax=Tetrapyrgos nigripes TaxID=182062 RepID=A0A8H5CE23_9AGAR|nr:hypothetical protein D9758_013146 [Tetrapyrgos nigripes]